MLLQGAPDEIRLLSRRQAAGISVASGWGALPAESEPAALELLRRVTAGAEGRAVLRRALGALRPEGGLLRLTDEQVVRTLARLLVAGELVLVARRQVLEARAQATITPPTPREVEAMAPPPPPPEPQPRSWIEIELVDDAGKPVPGEKYRIELPDGTVREGTLDSQGQARVDGIDPGNCQITFPELDEATWEPV